MAPVKPLPRRIPPAPRKPVASKKDLAEDAADKVGGALGGAPKESKADRAEDLGDKASKFVRITRRSHRRPPKPMPRSGK